MLQKILSQFSYKPYLPATLLTSVAVLAGLVLSIVYMLGICTESCSATASYQIFGLNFSLFGLLFFGAALVLLIGRQFVPAAHLILLLMFLSAAGAELHFTWLQKYEIARWCPICLSIAAAVYFGCAVLFFETFRMNDIRFTFKRFVLILAVFAIGAGVSFVGVSKEEPTVADYFLGNRKSPVTVYFVTDWFGPDNRRFEAVIAEACNRISKDVRIAFVDYPGHPETNYFTSYNLQFLALEKASYFKLRSMLYELAARSRKPTAEQVQAAVAPAGVRLKPMDNADLLAGLEMGMNIYLKYGIVSAPAIVVVNGKNQKHVVLKGEAELTPDKIAETVRTISAQ